jgi:hypothetical protein
MVNFLLCIVPFWSSSWASSDGFSEVDCPEPMYVWKDIVKPLHDAASSLRGERICSERLEGGHQISDANPSDIEMDLLARKIRATVVV